MGQVLRASVAHVHLYEVGDALHLLTAEDGCAEEDRRHDEAGRVLEQGEAHAVQARTAVP
jgi:hypothetical protein